MNRFLAHDIHSVINASAGMRKPEKTPPQTKLFSPELTVNNGGEIQDRLGVLAFAFDQSDEIVIVCDESAFIAKDISAHTPFYNLISNNEKQEFFTLVENSPDIILRYDLIFWCTYVNEAYEKIIGYPRYLISENFLGLSRFLPNEQIRWVKHNLRLVIESGLPIEFDLVLAHSTSGLPVYLQVIVVPEFNAEHRITGVMAVAHDISELKRKEEELVVAKDQAEKNCSVKSSFLATISREMRSPLSTIIGLSRLLKDETLSQEERNELLDLIEEAGMKIERMGVGILDLLKIESGNLELNLEN